MAISTNRVVAWMTRGGGSSLGEEWQKSIAPMPAVSDSWEELEVALRALAADSGGGSLFIALLPPLVQVRSIQLPPVDATDAAQLVSRGAAKYFVGAREPQVVSVDAREGLKGEGTHALACAASVRVVEAIREAAADAGWKVARVIPAQSAWITAADHVWAKSDALVDHGRVIVFDDDRTEVIFKSGGRAESFRHLRGDTGNGARLLDLLSVNRDTALAAASVQSRNGLRPVGIIGSTDTRQKLAPALRERGLQPLEPEGVYSKVMSSAPLAAAHFAPLTEELELVTEEVRSSKMQARNRLAAYLGAVAALLFLGGFGAQYWGMKRELVHLTARRDSVREAVNQVLDAQNKIGSLSAPIAGVDSLRHAAVRWSLVLSDVAQQLPSEAYILTLNARGDSVNFAGKGLDAGLALVGLGRVPSLQDVQQAGNISMNMDTATFAVVARVRREKPDGGGMP